jgi:diguanylate cyclase (GGDEF)-like protein
MNPFLSVRARLFALCLGLLAVMGGANLLLVDIIGQREPQEQEQRAQYERVQTIQAVFQAVNDHRTWQGQVNTATLLKNDSLRLHAEQRFADVKKEMAARMEEMRTFDPDTVEVVRREMNALPPEMNKFARLLGDGKQEEAAAIYSTLRRRIDSLEGSLNGAIEREQAQASAVQQREAERAASAVRRSIAILAISATAGLLMVLLVLRSIIKPLRSTVTAIRLVNAGETSLDLPPVGPDEFGDIAIALRQFRDHAERLRRLAFTDSLTGIGNRTRLEELLREGIEFANQNNTVLALVYLDVDNFRTVNDSLGHSAGDRYLCEASDRLQRFVPEDALVCRYGGDKFAVVLQGIPAWDRDTLRAHLRAVTETILRGMSEPFQLGADLLPMSASVGIAVFPGDGESGEQLVSAADAAMYLAKRQGRNNAQFATPDLTGDARKHLATVADIRRGLEASEFEPFYQPIVDIESRRVMGAEALLRWRHPHRGIVMAGEFIPAAEASGLIHALGEECMTRVCDQAKSWHAAGNPVRVSVNLSARQIEDQTAIRLLERLHAAGGEGAKVLDFEITETAMLQQVDRAQETLTYIRSLGHHLSVDDFGTGYSSLVYLQRFPVNRIKIDRSFVARVETSREAQAIVSATIALARSLELEVVAEGVETSGQVQKLHALGCHLQQGYYFTPALPAGQFEIWCVGEPARLVDSALNEAATSLRSASSVFAEQH